MSVLRAKVRHVLAALLKGRTKAGGNVVPTQITTWDEKSLPAIGVYTLRGDDQRASDAPPSYVTTVHVVIEFAVAQRYDANDNEIELVDDDLDCLSQEIRSLVLADSTLGGLAQDVRLNGFEVVGAEDGRRNVLGERLNLEVEFYDEPCQGDPTEIYDLKKLAVRFDLPNKGEVTTTSSLVQDGGRNILPAP